MFWSDEMLWAIDRLTNMAYKVKNDIFLTWELVLKYWKPRCGRSPTERLRWKLKALVESNLTIRAWTQNLHWPGKKVYISMVSKAYTVKLALYRLWQSVYWQLIDTPTGIQHSALSSISSSWPLCRLQPHQLGHLLQAETHMHIHISDCRRVHPRAGFCEIVYKLLHDLARNCINFISCIFCLSVYYALSHYNR